MWNNSNRESWGYNPALHNLINALLFISYDIIIVNSQKEGVS